MSHNFNPANYAKAAEEIKRRGYWDGHVHTDADRAEYERTKKVPACIGLAILELDADEVSDAEKDALMDHLGRQLGYQGESPAPYHLIFNKNDEFRGRPEEGKAWALDVLDKLARGESLV